MLLQFGNTLLQDKVMVGFSAEQFGLSIAEMVKLYEALPLKEAVVEKWLYGNARRFLRPPDVRLSLPSLREPRASPGFRRHSHGLPRRR